MNKKSRIRNAEPHLALIRQGDSFHVVRDVTNESDERLREIGFLHLEDGECVLPRALGSVTKRNCNGYDIVFRERAKEQYFIYFAVPGWHNTYHTASLERWRYPREHKAGYEMELTLMLKDGKRDALHDYLTDNGVGTVIHYPIPPHHQECYAKEAWNIPQLSLPITEMIANCELSLPISPCMSQEQLEWVVKCVNEYK